MRHEIVYRDADRYAAFPWVTRAADGTLLAVFREAGPATAQAALRGTHTHQDPDSRIFFARRAPGDEGWSPPLEVYRGDYAASDPAITVLSDGRYLARYARWHLVPSSRRPTLRGPLTRHFPLSGYVGATAGNGFATSRDGGQTWRPLESTTQPDLGRACSREAVIELTDGTLVLSVYDGYPAHNECAWLLRSFDAGATWGDASIIAGEPWKRQPYRGSVSFNETAVLPLDATTLLAVIRADASFHTDDDRFVSEGGVGELLWSVSRDVGLTWDAPRATGLWGQPAHLLDAGGGRVICTFGHRRSPYGVQAALCRADGRTFAVERRIVLRDDAPGWDCGYPATTAIGEGKFFSIYYLADAAGVGHIAATTWSIDEMRQVEPA